MTTREIARTAFWVVVGVALAALLIVGGIAKADPTDGICGTGKFYNQFSNSCQPTDRGAYPNTQPPNYGGGYGPRGYF